MDALAPDGVPVVANGDVFTWEDAQRVKRETGCAAAMIARAAMWNASVFRPQGERLLIRQGGNRMLQL